jgi:iron(III) transport system substrate-binding protein
VTMTGGYVPELIEKQMLAKYRSPMVPFLRKGFVDAEGYWPGVYAIGYTIIYNNRRVSQKDAPKRYEDLLQPRWKNNLLMDAEAHDLLAGLIDLWGEAKATSFLRQVVQEQKVTLSRQSHTFMTQLVATGEHDVIVDGYVHNAVALKEKGAPIDYIVMNPTIVRPPSIIAIVARAPHPYASALFLDYHLSKEASEIMVKSQGRWAPRRDVPWTVEPQGDLHVVSALQWGPKMRKLVDLFNKSIGQ